MLLLVFALGLPSSGLAGSFEPIDRLGVWSEGAFRSTIRPGSISKPHLYILVHGWAPGLEQAVERYRGPGPLLAWDRHARYEGTPYVDYWLAPMAAALAKLDRRAVVVAYSWLDDSATADDPLDASSSERKTVPNGTRLARLLNTAIGRSFRTAGGEIHLIGHSHGAKVATVAALGLRMLPQQLTLLDSPESSIPALAGAANDLAPLLRGLPIGRSPGTVFVDNYYSEFGEPYGDSAGLGAIVDTHLDPSQYSVDNVTARHLYPARWYTAATLDPSAGVGPEWSPLLGDVYETLDSFYEQAYPGDVARQLVLVSAPRP